MPQTKEKRNVERSRILSISERNKQTMDIVEEFQTEWNMGFSPTIFRVINDYKRIRNKIESHPWTVVREQLL
tara:strand:- start:832 stop:1047 length:216 start_codon:yes stop_codon:yes gene_type:complete